LGDLSEALAVEVRGTEAKMICNCKRLSKTAAFWRYPAISGVISGHLPFLSPVGPLGGRGGSESFGRYEQPFKGYRA